MGLFSRGDASARGRAEGERILRQAGEREERAARAMARRAGYDVAGAEHVAYEAPRSQRCLVVRPDRIDRYDEDPAAVSRSPSGCGGATSPTCPWRAARACWPAWTWSGRSSPWTSRSRARRPGSSTAC